MKKLCLLFFMSFAIGTAAFADHQGFGIGIIGGWGWPGHGYAGLSLKVPKLPIFWGIYPVFAGQSFGLGVTGDFYFIDKNIVNANGFKLCWYLGVGAFLNMYFWNSGAEFSLGGRVPIGLSWHIIKQVELFLDFAPGVGFSFNPGGAWGPYWAGAIELGLRFWL